jgi:hypothetical protein
MWKAPIYRMHYKKKYGTRCFLRPRDRAYPICSHGKIDCKGLRAAQYYLRLNRKTMRNTSANKKLWKKAKTLTRKYCKIN